MDDLRPTPTPGFVERGLEMLRAIANDRPSHVRIHADAIQIRYYQNTRATSSRLAGELRSEYDSIRRAALLRLARRLGFETARDVWRAAVRRVDAGARASDWRFRLECQLAAGAVLARGAGTEPARKEEPRNG